MILKTKLLSMAVVALSALLIVGCGSSSDTGGSQTKVVSGGDSSLDELFVSNGTEVLGRSATAFSADEITSGTGAMHFSFNMDNASVSGDADFAFEAPDKMHMTMKLGGGQQQSILDLSEVGTFEILALGHDIYMNIPILGGWYSFSPEDLGASGDELDKVMSRGSAIDYAGLVDQLTGNVTFIGREDVAGHSTVHYQFQDTLGGILASFADALDATGDDALTQQISDADVDGPISMDVWVGADDYLPYKLEATASITGQTPVDVALQATFDNYNQPVDIPDAPADAVSISDAFGLFGSPAP